MKTINLLIAFSTSALVSSCLHRAESLRMLEVRADYDAKNKDEGSMLTLANDPGNSGDEGSKKVAAKTANVWIFPVETSPTEYFWGGWLTVVVEGDRWQTNGESLLPKEPASSKAPILKQPKGKTKK